MKYITLLMLIVFNIASATNNIDKKTVEEAYKKAKTIVFADKKYGKLDKTEKGEERGFKYTFKYSSKLSIDQVKLYKKITKGGKLKEYSVNIKPRKITKADKKLIKSLKSFPEYKEYKKYFKIIDDTNDNGVSEVINMSKDFCGSGGCTYSVYEPDKNGKIKKIYTIEDLDSILNIKANGDRVRIYGHCSGHNNCTDVISHNFNGVYKAVFEYKTRRKNN